MKRNWIRKAIGGLSFASALFVFQACYGTPQDLGMDLLIEGQVNAKKTGLPIEGINVSVAKNVQYAVTDSEGKFSFYTAITETITLSFNDTDSLKNGNFASKDTVLTDKNEDVYLNVVLEEIQ